MTRGISIKSEAYRKIIREEIREEEYRNCVFTKDGRGYIFFKVPMGCRFSCMANSQGRVRLSRLKMAAFLNRPLTKEEVTHHINEDIIDNRIENLKLFENNGKHIAYHHKLNKQQ